MHNNAHNTMKWDCHLLYGETDHNVDFCKMNHLCTIQNMNGFNAECLLIL